MPKYVIKASQCVYYVQTVEAESEEQAIENFTIQNTEPTADGLQIEFIEELKENE